jgi:hypothetical protein
MSTYPHTGGTQYAPAQGSPWLVLNDSILRLDAFAVRVTVQGRQTAPPVACSDGDVYYVNAGGSGLWAGHDGTLAIAKGANASSGWIHIPAAAVERTGNKIYIVNEGITMVRGASAWGEGREILVDMTGAPDGGVVRWDASNGVFYVAAA